MARKVCSISVVVVVDGERCHKDCPYDREGECDLFGELLDIAPKRRTCDAIRSLRCQECVSGARPERRSKETGHG